jgi:glutaredoxin
MNFIVLNDMEITIYTTIGCIYCEKIKELMKRTNLEYTNILIGRDITRKDFKIKYPFASGFPYVIIDDKEIGGLVETVKLFVEKGLVSSKKK